MKSKKSEITADQGLGPFITDHVQRLSVLLPVYMRELIAADRAGWGFDACVDLLAVATMSLALISNVEHSTENDGRRLFAIAAWLKSIAEKNQEALLVPVAKS
jgi:hypothetical protein